MARGIAGRAAGARAMWLSTGSSERFFNAGVRAFDVSGLFHPREVGHLAPGLPPGSPVGAVQINVVYVDEVRII